MDAPHHRSSRSRGFRRRRRVRADESRPASASEFAINACQADRANYSTQAFDDFATRGMMWKRACDPEGPGLRGLVTSNVPRAGRVPRGSRSYFVMNAPEGTRFARFTWSGQARRRDCRYALQLWASRPDGAPTPIKNVRANSRCPRRGYAQAAGWPRPRTYDIAGATKIVQRIVCVGEKKDAALLVPRPELHPDVQGPGDGGGREPTGGERAAGQPVHAGAVGERAADGELRGESTTSG